MNNPSTISSCRRNYLRRMHRLGLIELDSLRTKVLRDALTGPPKRPPRTAAGWSNCRLCDLEYKIRGHRFIKGFAIVRCTGCGVWQRPKV